MVSVCLVTVLVFVPPADSGWIGDLFGFQGAAPLPALVQGPSPAGEQVAAPRDPASTGAETAEAAIARWKAFTQDREKKREDAIVRWAGYNRTRSKGEVQSPALAQGPSPAGEQVAATRDPASTGAETAEATIARWKAYAQDREERIKKRDEAIARWVEYDRTGLVPHNSEKTAAIKRWREYQNKNMSHGNDHAAELASTSSNESSHPQMRARWQEYGRMVESKRRRYAIERTKKAAEHDSATFSDVDTDGSGRISAFELEVHIKRTRSERSTSESDLEVYMKTDAIKQDFSAHDLDGDGNIGLAEALGDLMDDMEGTSAEAQQQQQRKREAEMLRFTRCDFSRDEALSLREWTFYRHMYIPESDEVLRASAKEAQELLTKHDSDNDGELSIEEARDAHIWKRVQYAAPKLEL